MYTPLDILSIETWILLASILILIRLYIRRRWQYLKNLNIPHEPPSIMELGNFKMFMKEPEKFLTADFEWRKKYGSVYGYYTWLSPKIVVWDPEILKHIFIKEFSNFPDRQKQFTRINGKELNASLTSVSGEQWRRIRHTLSPLFSASKLKGMMEIVDECADKLIENLSNSVEESDGKFDVRELYRKYSMDVVCSAAFCMNVNSQTQEDNKTMTMAKKLFDNFVFKNPIFWLILIFPPLEDFFGKLNFSLSDGKVLDYFKRMTDYIIEKQKDGQKKKVDFMNTMLQSEVSEEEARRGSKGITRTEVVGNAMIMILAGFDNIANSFMFLTYCVAMCDGVQEKLYDELKQAMDANDGKLTYEAINSMKYLDMCLKESLRMYPVTPRNARFCEKEITIKGLTIPAGVAVEIPVHALSNDEDYWDEPGQFRPERFEDISKIDPMKYLPFGAGPRNCIGMRFALFEVKVGLCRLMQKFVLSPSDDTPPPPLELSLQGSVRPKKDLFLRVTPRKAE